MERRLTAIFAADVVGYSRLMERDETGTLAALRAHRKDIIDPKIAEHHGRTVKLMGDGALVEFPSVVGAVQCAYEIQKLLSDRNAEIPTDRRIEFRIGVHVGDVIVEGDDIYGEGVNVAARLESLAVPGGICISDWVYQSVSGKMGVKFEDLGKRDVKNLTKPVHVYGVAVDGQPQESGAVRSGRNGSRRRWLVGAVVVTFLIAFVFLAGPLREWSNSDTHDPACTDHLGLVVPEEECLNSAE